MTTADWAEYYGRKAATFDELAATYENVDPYRRAFYRERAARTLGVLDPKPGERILDVGCGTGFHARAMVEAGARVVATDLAAPYVERASAFVGGRAEFRVEDAQSLSFADDSFDKVLMADVIEHLPDAAAAVHEAHRVVRPGGRLVVSTPSRHSPMNLAYGIKRRVRGFAVNEHVHEFTAAELDELLSPRFEVARAEFANFLMPYPFDGLYARLGSPGVSALPALDRALGRTPGLRRLGWTLIVAAERRA